jgi:serine/threonine protein kinase
LCDTELKLGKVLGVGAFGRVCEVLDIEQDDAPMSMASISRGQNRQSNEFVLNEEVADDEVEDPAFSATTSMNDSMRDDSYYQVSKARDIMARRCLRNGEARYAVKALMKENLTDMQYARGRIDLAIEVKYLQALSHPNIVKLRGLYKTDDPLHPDYFFVMDRLYGTLDTRITEWQTESWKAKMGILHMSERTNRLEDLFVRRLKVAFDIVSAFKYMHSYKMVYRYVSILRGDSYIP